MTVYPLPHSNDETCLRLFQLIKEYDGKVTNLSQLEELIFKAESIKGSYSKDPDDSLSSLKEALRCFDEQFKINYIRDVLPSIFESALSAKSLFIKTDFNTLARKTSGKIVLNGNQIRCLLANNFLNCLACLPGEYGVEEYGDISFFRVFIGSPYNRVNVERSLCMLSYFYQVQNRNLNWDITFYRKSSVNASPRLPNWSKHDVPLDLISEDVTLQEKGGMEDSQGATIVDFANKRLQIHRNIGSATQEEVLFSARPELFVAMLFCDKMCKGEVIIVNNVRMYCTYTGYSQTFTYTGHTEDIENSKGKCIVALDAIISGNQYNDGQFSEENLSRDLNKAFLGFQSAYNTEIIEIENDIVSTGNWGCGVFQGNHSLKFLQQIMAAKAAGKRLDFYTFENAQCQIFPEILKLLIEKNPTFQRLYSLLIQYPTKSRAGKEIGAGWFSFLQGQTGQLQPTVRESVYEFLQRNLIN